MASDQPLNSGKLLSGAIEVDGGVVPGSVDRQVMKVRPLGEERPS